MDLICRFLGVGTGTLRVFCSPSRGSHIPQPHRDGVTSGPGGSSCGDSPWVPIPLQEGPCRALCLHHPVAHGAKDVLIPLGCRDPSMVPRLLIGTTAPIGPSPTAQGSHHCSPWAVGSAQPGSH